MCARARSDAVDGRGDELTERRDDLRDQGLILPQTNDHHSEQHGARRLAELLSESDGKDDVWTTPRSKSARAGC